MRLQPASMRFEVLPARLLFALCLGWGLVSSTAAPLKRTANNTIQMPAAMDSSGYTTIEAFPGLQFEAPVALTHPPGETNRLFVVEKAGRVVVITNLASPTRTVFLDVSDRTDPGGEGGLLGLAFHPNFVNNRQFYIFYTLNASSVNRDGTRNDGLHDRLSRFIVSKGDPNSADPNSELVLISQYDRASNHNGGDLHFGPDGYLYVSLGDEGGGGDGYWNSQHIDHNFFSGLLRLDVDKRPGSLAPNQHGAATSNYRVPPDNPFVGATEFNGLPVDPSQVRTEFWAVGFRNPWRFTFDPATGDLLCGDVGQSAVEEVDLVVRGGNYGWSFFEGSLPFTGFPPFGFADIKPIAEYGRPGISPDPERQGFSVIGGVVYRGSALPELSGRYIFGDWGSGFIWALQHDGIRATEFRHLLNAPSMICFGTDPRNGDVLVGAWTILRLVRAGGGQGAPTTLSATGLFADVASLTPSAGVVPYQVNVPFWSDNAVKQRWFSVPDLAQTMTFRPDSNWTFPAGSVWIKHFDLEMIQGVPASARRIETRVLVKTKESVYGVTYRWNDTTGDATLVPPEGGNEEFIIEGALGPRRQVWRYPSQSECLSCHTSAGGYVLGFNTAQLNRESHYGGNQLQVLAEAGYLGDAIVHPENLLRLASIDDESASVELRVRSYLAANCTQCHQPGGAGRGSWDARVSVPMANAGLINGMLMEKGNNPNARVVRPGSLTDSMLFTRISHRGTGQMPPLGSSLIDTQATNLFRDWIIGVLGRPTGEPITLESVGAGTIRGLTNQQRLIPEQHYKVAAVPLAGHLFSHWDGTILSHQNPLRFAMETGIVLRANFVTNRFLAHSGLHQGVFEEDPSSNGFALSGGISVVIRKSGTFSARLDAGKKRIRFSGRFGVDGLATQQIARSFLGPLAIELALNDGDTQLIGRITASTWTASLAAVQPAKTLPRRFTWASNPDLINFNAEGSVCGTIRINAAGKATLLGTLADGSSFAHMTVLSRDGRLPVHHAGDKGSRSGVGWLGLSPDGRTVSGALEWFLVNESGDPGSVSADSSVTVICTGSLHSGVDLLPTDTLLNLTFSAGGLDGSTAASLRVPVGRKRAVNMGPPPTSLILDRQNGLFSGSFTTLESPASHRFKGVILSEQGYGIGFFLGPTGVGLVDLRY